MELDVAAPWWWTPAAVATAIVGGIYFWTSYAARYEGIRRMGIRLFAIIFAIGFPILIQGKNSNYIRVRDDRVEVRGEFMQAQRSYRLADISSYGFERQGGATSRSRRYTALVLLFRDGSTAEVSEHMSDYERLKAFLANAGIPQR
jgi:hypothetical protein